MDKSTNWLIQNIISGLININKCQLVAKGKLVTSLPGTCKNKMKNMLKLVYFNLHSYRNDRFTTFNQRKL